MKIEINTKSQKIYISEINGLTLSDIVSYLNNICIINELIAG